MAFLMKLLLHVIFPGATGFAVSYTVVVPQMLTGIVGVPGASLLAIGATGLLTFALASVVRGSSQRVTQRFFGQTS